MFGSQVLDVAIGLVFVFLIFSLVISAINELVASFFQMRAKNLHAAIKQMLGDEKAKEFFNHPLINSISMPAFAIENRLKKPKGQNGWTQWNSSQPAYLKPEEFSRTVMSLIQDCKDCRQLSQPTSVTSLLDQLDQAEDVHVAKTAVANFAQAQEANSPNQPVINLQSVIDDSSLETPAMVRTRVNSLTAEVTRHEFQTAVEGLDESPLANVIRNSINHAGSELSAVQMELQNWFDRSMMQAEGWYKKKIQAASICFSFLIAAGFNVNALNIAQELYRDQTLREAIVAHAENVKDLDPEEARKLVKDYEDISALNLPIGWSTKTDDTTTELEDGEAEQKENGIVEQVAGFVWKRLLPGLPGIILTSVAISLGSSFWFDMLNKLFRFRTQIKMGASEPQKPTPSDA